MDNDYPVHSKKHHKKRKLKITLTVTIVLLIALRLALPYVILHFANKTLAKMSGYYGHIKDIDLALYRGAYKIKKMYLHKKDSITNLETEFFDTEEIDLSVHWGALLDGRIVGELEVEEPTLRFIKDKTEPKQIQKDTSDFRNVLNKFMPLEINRFEIHNGIIKYLDKTANPKVDIEMNNTHIKAENLTTVKGGSTLPATVTASADIYEGTLDLNLRLDPLADDPTFDLNTELKNTNLVKLNDFFKAYGKFDVTKGSFGLFVEVAAKEGEFVGYAKPLIQDLKVLGPEDKDDNVLKKFWEGLVGGVGFIFKNQRQDQVATKVPIEGNFNKTKVYTWRAILEILRNAFVEALAPTVDNEINLGSVGNTDRGVVNIKKQDKNDKKKDKDSNDTKEGEKSNDPATQENGEKKEKKGLLKKLFNKKDKEKDGESQDSTKK
jgi:hypothetical protein